MRVNCYEHAHVITIMCLLNIQPVLQVENIIGLCANHAKMYLYNVGEDIS